MSAFNLTFYDQFAYSAMEGLVEVEGGEGWLPRRRLKLYELSLQAKWYCFFFSDSWRKNSRGKNTSTVMFHVPSIPTLIWAGVISIAPLIYFIAYMTETDLRLHVRKISKHVLFTIVSEQT